MAYCLKCGAYIPDGQTACLACGYDALAEQKKAEKAKSSSGAAKAFYSEHNEEMRSRLEKQRPRSQEQNRRWAEQERLRREEQAAREAARREQQEKDRQWAQEEYARRKEQQRSAAAPDREETYAPQGTSSGEGNKALAAISYLSVLFAVPFVFAPNDKYAKFHAVQGLKLFVFGIAADILGSLVGLGWIATLVRLYLIYKGMSNALNGSSDPLPWIGTIGDKETTGDKEK